MYSRLPGQKSRARIGWSGICYLGWHGWFALSGLLFLLLQFEVWIIALVIFYFAIYQNTERSKALEHKAKLQRELVNQAVNSSTTGLDHCHLLPKWEWKA